MSKPKIARKPQTAKPTGRVIAFEGPPPTPEPRVEIPERRTIDGTPIPIREVESAALAEGAPQDGDLTYATIGDLIVRCFTDGDLYTDLPGHPELADTFTQACLRSQAMELRCAAVAQASETPVDAEAMARHLAMLARRSEALAELSSRLRIARWGAPAFGGSGDATEGEASHG